MPKPSKQPQPTKQPLSKKSILDEPATEENIDRVWKLQLFRLLRAATNLVETVTESIIEEIKKRA